MRYLPVAGGRATARRVSSWAASENSISSAPKRPTKCRPIGRPSSVQASGTDIAGTPVALHTAVNGDHRRQALLDTARPCRPSAPCRAAGCVRAIVGDSSTSCFSKKAPSWRPVRWKVWTARMYSWALIARPRLGMQARHRLEIVRTRARGRRRAPGCWSRCWRTSPCRRPRRSPRRRSRARPPRPDGRAPSSSFAVRSTAATSTGSSGPSPTGLRMNATRSLPGGALRRRQERAGRRRAIGIAGLAAGHRVEQRRAVAHGDRHAMLRARAGQGLADRRQADPAARRLQAEQAAQRRRDADRAAAVGGVRHRQAARRDDRRRAAGRSAGREVLAPRIDGRRRRTRARSSAPARTRWCWCGRRSPGRPGACARRPRCRWRRPAVLAKNREPRVVGVPAQSAISCLTT